MEGLIVLGIIVGALAVFGVLAIRLGVDSREGSTDPRLPLRDLAI